MAPTPDRFLHQLQSCIYGFQRSSQHHSLPTAGHGERVTRSVSQGGRRQCALVLPPSPRQRVTVNLLELVDLPHSVQPRRGTASAGNEVRCQGPRVRSEDQATGRAILRTDRPIFLSLVSMSIRPCICRAHRHSKSAFLRMLSNAD